MTNLKIEVSEDAHACAVVRAVVCGDECGGAATMSYQPSAGRTLIRAGHVIDVHTGNELADETVIVQGDKIVGAREDGGHAGEGRAIAVVDLRAVHGAAGDDRRAYAPDDGDEFRSVL